jgi:autotransporter-associated beta strand protein
LAVQYFWDSNGDTAGAGTAPTGTWGTDLFWNTTAAGDVTAPTNATTTALDDLFFSAGTDATGVYTVTLGANQSARSLTFEEGVATLTGNTLTLTGGGITTLAGSGDPIFSSNLTISGGNIFNVGTGRTLTLNGTTFTRGTRATLNVRGGGTVTSTMTGLSALTNGILGPWASIGTGGSTRYATVVGGNITSLAGSDIAVDSIVSAPTFNYNVSAGGTLGASASVNTLRYTGAAGTIAGALTARGIMNAGSGLLTFSSPVTSGAPATELVLNAANADIALGGVVTGTLVKTGSGTVTLASVANVLANIPNWTVNEGVLVTNTSTNDGLGLGTINSGGTLRWGSSTDFGNGAVFTINAGGIFDMNGFTDLIGGISGAGTVTNGGASALLQLGDTTRTFSGQIQGPINLVKRNGGDQTLSGENTFTGTTAVTNPGTDATLTLANSLALQNSALDTTTSVAGTTAFGLRSTVTTLTLGGLTGNKDLASVFRQDSSGGPGGTTALGGYSGVTALTLNPGASVTRSYSAIIADGALGMTLTKTGAGTQVLSGANSYTGGTTVTAGILQPTLATALADYTSSGKVVFNGGTIAVVLDETAAAGWSTPQVDLLLANATKTSGALAIDTSAASVSFAPSNLSGPIGLTKLGTNTLTLTSSNTHTGNTTISAGTLRLENTGAVQNSAVVSVGARTLEIATDTAFSVFPTLSAQAGTIVSDRANPGAGLTHVLGDASIGNGITNFTAGANVTGGTAAIQLGNISNNNGSVATPRLNPTTANLIITGGVTLGTSNAGTANFVLDGTGSVNSIAGAIVNGTRVTGNVAKVGTSTWTLSGINTYTGNTTVTGGTLRINGDQTGATGAVTVGGASASGTPTLEGIGTLGGNVTIATAGAGVAGTLAPGSGGIGNLVLNGTTLTFETGSTASFEVDADTIANRDRVTGISTMTYGGTLKITATGTLTAGDTWDLFDFSSQSGTFANDASFGTDGASDPDLPDLDAGLTWAFDYSTGTLSVAGSASPYDTWAIAKGLTGLPGSSTDPAKTADPDKDGKNNLQEFALDGNPLSGANDGKVVGKVATVSAAQVLTLTLPVRNGAVFSDASGPEVSALIDGVIYRIESGVNLVAFADDVTQVPAGPELDVIQFGLTPLSTGWTYRTFRAPGTVPTASKAFLRARISETP